MKKLLTILFTLVSAICFSQTRPIQPMGTKVNEVKMLGALSIDTALFVTPYATLAAANITGQYARTRGGSIIFVKNESALYIRNDAATAWIKIAAAADIPPLYTSEDAQDAIGAMINASLQYVDATPLLAINDRDFGSVSVTGSGLIWTIDPGAVTNSMLANSSITINGTSVSLGGTRTLVLASADFANQGTATTVLHGNAAGSPTWAKVDLANDVSNRLPVTNFAQVPANSILGNSTASTADIIAIAIGQNQLVGRGSTGNVSNITIAGSLSFSGNILSGTGITSEVDGSITNELQTYAHTGTTSYTNTLSQSGGSFTLQAAGINVISHSAGTVTITATEVDGSVSNELQTLANTSNATSHTTTLSSTGGSLQLVESGIITLTTTGTALNGIVTIGATEVDGSITNEIQTISNTSDATSHTATLSSTGGSIKFIEGTGITLTSTGTGLDGIVTIASTGGITLAAIGGTPNANAATVTGGNVLNLEPASTSFGGVVTTGTQSFAGFKTYINGFESHNGNTLNFRAGLNALVNATTATYNVAIGEQAGLNVVTGGENTFVGVYSGRNVTGGSNVAIGVAALQGTGTLLTGGNNVAIGSRAMGQAQGNANENIAIGANAMIYSTSTATGNIAIGGYAGQSTGGSANVYIGFGVGGQIPSAGQNTFVGNESARYGTTIANSVFMGYSAGWQAYGSYNVYIGHNVAYLATGQYNVFIGGSSNAQNPNAVSQGVSVGYGANNSGNQSVSIGFGANANDEGVSVGYGATGNARGTAVGINSQATGYGATSVGYGGSASGSGAIRIGNYNTYANGNTSVAIGYAAGTVGEHGVAVGTGAYGNLISVAIGQAQCLQYGTIAIGGEGVVANGEGGIAMGRGMVAGVYEMVVGYNYANYYNLYIGNGRTAAAPAPVTILSSQSNGTVADAAGANLSFVPGNATGNAVGGSLLFYTSDAGASGVTAQLNTVKMTITAAGVLKLANVVQDDAETKVLVWNSTDKDVQWRAASTLTGGAGGGYTNMTQFLTQTPYRLFISDLNGDVQELAYGTSGQVLQSNGASANPSWTTPTGGVGDGDKTDITVTASGATWLVDNDAITYAKLQNVAANSFLANITGAAADVQAIATNRIPLFSSAITGTPSNVSFLRGDGTWIDMSSGTIWNGTVGGTTEATGNGTLTSGVQWIYSGSAPGTFTMPDRASYISRIFFVKNASAFNLTVQRGGSDQIYTTSAVTSFTLLPGESRMMGSGSSYWYSYFPQGGAGGGVSSFAFTDVNGFAGTVTNSTTTPSLSLVTTAADQRIMYSSSGAIAGDAGFKYDAGTATMKMYDGTLDSRIEVMNSGGTFGTIISGSGFGWVQTAFMELRELSTQATPSGGFGKIYFKSDHLPYALNSAGTEMLLFGGGGGGVTTMGTIGGTPNANGATISGTTLTLQPADGTFGGILSTATQTIAGQKTFLQNVLVSNSVLATGDLWTDTKVLTKELSAAPAQQSGYGVIWTKDDGTLHFRNDAGTDIQLGAGGGGGEANTASNVGGGLANFNTKSGVDLQFNTFSPTDFDLGTNVFFIDYVNGQAASGTLKGFLTSANWTTFNSKQAGIQYEDEGVAQGTAGTVSEIDFVGAGVTVSRATNTLTVTIAGGGSSGIVIGTTTITGSIGTGDIIFNNSGVAGGYAISGTGSVVMTTSGSLTTPTVATSIAPFVNDGATLGTSALKFSDIYLATGATIVHNTATLSLPLVTGTLTQFAEASVASSGTWSPPGDARDNYYDLTLQAAAVTVINAPSGTPANHNTLIIRVKSDGTARAIAGWNAIYRASTNLAFPTTTTLSRTMYIKFIYSSTDSKWDLVSVLDGF